MSHKTVGSTVVRPASDLAVLTPHIDAPVTSSSASSARAQALTTVVGAQKIQFTTSLFLGRTAPFNVRSPGQFDMIVFWGNHTNETIQGGKITLVTPALTVPTLESSNSPSVVYYYSYTNPNDDGLHVRSSHSQLLGGIFTIDTLDMPPHTIAAVKLSFVVRSGLVTKSIEDRSLSITSNVDLSNGYATTGSKTALPMVISIEQDNLFTWLYDKLLGPIFNGINAALAGILQQNSPATPNSRSISVVGADIIHLTNGCAIIPLGGGRTAVIGPSSVVGASEGNILADDGSVRVAAGHKSVSGFVISGINTSLRANQTWAPDSILEGLSSTNPGFNMVAAGGGNMVAAGGGNMVAAGGGNLIDNTTGAIAGPVSFRGPTLVSNGVDMVAAGGGNMLATGMKLINQDGSTLINQDGSTLIGMDGSTLIGMDGASFRMATTNLVAAGGGNMVAAGGGNMVAAGGGNLVAAGGMNLTSSAVSGLISSSAGSVLAGRIAGAGLTTDLARSQFLNSPLNGGGIMSHNGGQILNTNGVMFRAP